MKEIIVYVTTGYSDSERRRVIEVPDDATEEEIQEEALETVYELIDWGWIEKSQKENS